MGDFCKTFFFWGWLFYTNVSSIQEGCTSPQYLELGKTGNIQCFFLNDFFSVAWYNSTDIVQEPILVMKSSVKSGTGYLSGEFDVYANGSLRINHVSLQHEEIFTVLKFDSNVADPNLFVIEVKTFVHPVPTHPHVAGCYNDGSLCILRMSNNTELMCSIRKSRPALNLRWVVRTVINDINISSHANVTANGGVYSSYVSTRNIFQATDNLALLVCKADDPTGLMGKTEQQVLVLNVDTDFWSFPPTLLHFERYTDVELQCGEYREKALYIVWMRLRDSVYEYLFCSISASEHFRSCYVDDIDVWNNGSLHINQTKVQQEGLYYCISGDGVTESIKAYNVSVKVNPDPPHPVVHVCNEKQECVLEVQSGGNITCSLSGIRPEVGLEWTVLSRDEQPYISFANATITVTESDDTFNIRLTSTVHFKGEPYDRGLVECKASGQNAKLFDLSTTLDLIFVNENHLEQSTSEINNYVTIIIAASVLVIMSIVVFGVFGIRAYYKNRHLSEDHKDHEENIPMNPQAWKNSRNKGMLRETPRNEIFVTKTSDTVECSSDWSKPTLMENTLHQHLQQRQCADSDALRIVIFGKIGVGKSATGNSILGDKIFFEDLNTIPVTLRSTSATRNVNGRVISIIDTPGLLDSDWNKNDIKAEVARIIMMFSEGVHAFLYVLSIASPRLNEEDVHAIRNLENVIGGNMEDYRLLVYSHYDSLSPETTLDKYWNGQKKGRESISSFLQSFRQNVVGINNKCNSQAEKKRYQTAIIALTDRLREQNDNLLYTNTLFRKAAKEKEKLQKIAKTELGSAIVQSVEKVFATNDKLDVCCTEFVDEVLTQLQKQNLIFPNQSKSLTHVSETLFHADDENVIHDRKNTFNMYVDDEVRNDVKNICVEYNKIVGSIQSSLKNI